MLIPVALYQHDDTTAWKPVLEDGVITLIIDLEESWNIEE